MVRVISGAAQFLRPSRLRGILAPISLLAALGMGAAAVELRGGTLEIEWRNAPGQDGHVLMTGEAVEVFKGEIEIGADEIVAVG